jgi:Co/Zn/Cd efflux system component
MSFGFHRAEVIGALVSVLMIWVVTAVLFYIAILRTFHHDFEINSSLMLITSAFGIVVNIV